MGDIAGLCSDNDIIPLIHDSQSTTSTCEASSDLSCDADCDRTQETPCITEDSGDTSGLAESSEYKCEEDSFYSMDSANQDAHPLLLSMPIIPQIKLERKATIRKPESEALPDAGQNEYFLSPRIPDLRTSARVSSRRYGRILARTGPPMVDSDATLAGNHGRGVLSSRGSRRSETKLTYTRSTSEPVLTRSTCLSVDEEHLLKKEIDESPHSDVLLSLIDEVGSSPGPYSDRSESSIDELPGQKPTPAKHSKRSHQRSSLSYSISFSGIVHAVTDGCVSLDLFLRKSKSKSKSTTKHKYQDRIPHMDDTTPKWAPKHGKIVIKVFVPSTDDIWMFRVPQNINLVDFTSKVVNKLGLSVSFSGSLWDEPKYYFRTDERFKSWVNSRIRYGRNLPIVAHVPPRLPLMRLNVDGDGCEVWCYA